MWTEPPRDRDPQAGRTTGSFEPEPVSASAFRRRRPAAPAAPKPRAVDLTSPIGHRMRVPREPSGGGSTDSTSTRTRRR
jgi:hypothetical protein